jgi:murein DD-endopeptidase MepM/ murein hydrolase activator NlpD
VLGRNHGDGWLLEAHLHVVRGHRFRLPDAVDDRPRGADDDAGGAGLQFRDAFQQLGDSQVEAKFADTRTYVYKGKDVDQQVHLGFDLAVTANVPIKAAQKGVIVHAAYLGIYGNCVIVDHGMGVQSLYGHLSSIDVKVGDRVEKGQVLGKSGMTGLAGGDHLHFTMLVGGQQVTPVDWWSQQWMEDRVLRKIKAAGGPAS